MASDTKASKSSDFGMLALIVRGVALGFRHLEKCV